MTEYKTLRVPKPKWKQAREQKEANDRTWGEQIVRPVEEASTTAGAGVEDSVESDVVQEISKRIDDLEAELPRKVAQELEARR